VTRAKRIAAAIERWFADNERDLPWRVRTRGKRNPYFALVSEAMLQQTQASRIAERFGGFIKRFPDLEALARASDDDVLSAWDGLGYYRRARHLRDAARAVVESHSGRIPRDIEALRTLPGVGAYSAGSIASIAFEERAAIVDANVERIVLRVEGKRLRKGSKEAAELAWERAEELVRAAESPGRFNEGLMELGGLVCTPRSPTCGACPLSRLCVARREGAAEAIPLAKAAPAKSDLHFGVVVVQDGRGRVLLEQRPDAGLWRRMWQAPTVERTDRAVRRAEAARYVGLVSGDLRRRGVFVHETSHRTVRVVVWGAEKARASAPASRRWVDFKEMDSLAMGSALRRAVGLAVDGPPR
jgi:A/G-specific adenine glycosylase